MMLLYNNNNNNNNNNNKAYNSVDIPEKLPESTHSPEEDWNFSGKAVRDYDVIVLQK